MSVSEFNQKIKQLGLNLSASTYMGQPLLTESEKEKFIFKCEDKSVLQNIVSRIGFEDKALIENGQLVYDFEDRVITENKEVRLDEKFFNRINMPQIDTGKMLDDLKAAEIKYAELDIAAKDLEPSQKDFNMEKVKRIVEEGKWKSKPIICSNDGFVVDGHHRWKAALEKESEVKAIKVDLSLKQLLKHVKDKDYVTYKSLKESIDIQDSKAILNKQVEEGNCIELCVEQDEGKTLVTLTVTGPEGEEVLKQTFDTIAAALKVAKKHDVEVNKETVMKLYQTFI